MTIRFSSPHLPRTGAGVVPVVRLLSSPTACAVGAGGRRLVRETRGRAVAALPAEGTPILKALPFARVVSLLQITSKGAEG